MAALKQIAGSRWVMLVAAVAITLYYLLVFRPLSQRADALDAPLNAVQQELFNTSLENNGVRNLDLVQIRGTQEKLRASLLATEKTAQLIAKRIELEPEIGAKLKAPFLSVDFMSERQNRIEQLNSLAKTQQVTLEATALADLPEHKADMIEPNLLWAQLAIAHHILTVAINNQVGTIKHLGIVRVQDHRAAGGVDAGLKEIQVRIQLVGPMAAVARFLAALPLRADEMKTAGLPDSRPGKPALFLDKLILRKQSPEKPAEASLDAVICGFVRATALRPPRPLEKPNPE